MVVSDEAGPRYPSRETFYNMLGKSESGFLMKLDHGIFVGKHSMIMMLGKSVSVTGFLVRLDQDILVRKHSIICWENLCL